MRKLHWHTEDNPCLIAGHKVTPESWVGGGIIEQLEDGHHQHGRWFTTTDVWDDGTWDYSQHFYMKENMSDNIYILASRPIYPPKGFGGLSEGEIWEGMTHHPQEDEHVIIYDDCWHVGIMSHGITTLLAALPAGYTDPEESIGLTDIPALILALQNAQVLSERLKGAL